MFHFLFGQNSLLSLLLTILRVYCIWMEESFNSFQCLKQKTIWRSENVWGVLSEGKVGTSTNFLSHFLLRIDVTAVQVKCYHYPTFKKAVKESYFFCFCFTVICEKSLFIYLFLNTLERARGCFAARWHKLPQEASKDQRITTGVTKVIYSDIALSHKLNRKMGTWEIATYGTNRAITEEVH